MKLIDYPALGKMMGKQATLMANALNMIDRVLNSRTETAVKLVNIAEIMGQLEQNLEKVS